MSVTFEEHFNRSGQLYQGLRDTEKVDAAS